MKKLLVLVLAIILAIPFLVYATDNYDNYMERFSVSASSSTATLGKAARTSRTKISGFNPSYAYNVYPSTFPATATSQVCEPITPRSYWSETYKGAIYFLTEPGQSPITITGAERYGYK